MRVSVLARAQWKYSRRSLKVYPRVQSRFALKMGKAPAMKDRPLRKSASSSNPGETTGTRMDECDSAQP